MNKPSLSRVREWLTVVALCLGIVLMSATLVAGGLGLSALLRAGQALSEAPGVSEAPVAPVGPSDVDAPAPGGETPPTTPVDCATVDERVQEVPPECK